MQQAAILHPSPYYSQLTASSAMAESSTMRTWILETMKIDMIEWRMVLAMKLPSQYLVMSMS